jgi:branched-chain amino acid transport system substrate-binding protein
MMRDGALLAIEHWNANGGVLGKTVEAVVEDSQCTPDPAVNAANRLMDEDKVKYIIRGDFCSNTSVPVSEIANSKRVVQISPDTTDPDVTVGKNGKVKDYVFRACTIDPFQIEGTGGAKFALDTLKAKTAFILLNQTDDYAKGLAEYFEKAFVAGGGKIVGKETYTAEDTNFNAILAKVAAAKPEVMYLPDLPKFVNLVTKQAKGKGVKAVFMGGYHWNSRELDMWAADGSFFTNYYSPKEPRPEIQNFVKTFGAKYKDDIGKPKVPNIIAALTYDATNMLLQAIKTAGADDTAKVKDALAMISFSTVVSGKITRFDLNHNLVVKSTTILAVKGGAVAFDSIVNW